MNSIVLFYTLAAVTHLGLATLNFIRMENDRLFKDHNKANNEIANMNCKFNTMSQHMERLEEEMATKNHAITLEQSVRKKVEKLGQRKQAELDCNKKSLQVRLTLRVVGRFNSNLTVWYHNIHHHVSLTIHSIIQAKDSVMSKQDEEVSQLSRSISKMENEAAHKRRAHDQVCSW